MTRHLILALAVGAAGASLLLTACQSASSQIEERPAPITSAPITSTPATPPISPPDLRTGPPPGGFTAPADHANVTPINTGPNPFETQLKWAKPYDMDTIWGSVTAIQMAPDGEHIWAANRCGANSCVGSQVNVVALLRPDGSVVKSFGKGLFAWPHGMEVDEQGNIWVTDARAATPAELSQFPNATNIGHSVRKFSPDGELLMTIGTPGESGLPPTHLNEPNDVVVAPNGNIYIAQGHRAQFVDAFGPSKNDVNEHGDINDARFSYISVFAPDGTYIRSFGEWGYEDGQFRTPHAMDIDSQGRLFISDRGNRRLQILTLEGEHIESWYQFSRVSGLYIAPDDTLYAIDSESSESRNPGWSKGLRIGSAKTGELSYFIAPHFFNGTIGSGAIGEGVTANAQGHIYAGELGPDSVRGITKFTKTPNSE